MNVTKANFDDVAAEIEALLPSAAFVAIDEEMSGISFEDHNPYNVSDVPAKRYDKMREVASWYSIIEFGMALFHEKECVGDMPPGSTNYEAHVYNFHLFPESGLVNMEVSAVAFNTEHHMDWNAWIRDGIPYVSRKQAKVLKEKMVDKDDTKAREKQRARRSPLVLTKQSDIDATGKAVDALKAWLEDDDKKDETEFELIEANAFVRRFMYDKIEEEFPDLITESRATPVKNLSKMFVLRLSEAGKKERMLTLRREKEAEYLKKIGFLRIWSALVDAKKPLVGHAISYDLLFALSHFDGPLPKSYPVLKARVHELFPLLFDTKFLVTVEAFKYKQEDAGAGSVREPRFGGRGLAALHKVLADETKAAKEEAKPIVEVTFAAGHDLYPADCNAFHEAGFDAYITGCVFAHMAKEVLAGDLSMSVNGRIAMWRSNNHFNVHGDDDDGVYVHARDIKGCNENYIKAAFGFITVQVGKGSKMLMEKDIEIKWIDENNGIMIFPAVFRDEIAQKVRERAQVNGGPIFTSWSDWLAERNETGYEEVSRLFEMMELAPEEAEPARKRAKV